MALMKRVKRAFFKQYSRVKNNKLLHAMHPHIRSEVSSPIEGSFKIFYLIAESFNRFFFFRRERLTKSLWQFRFIRWWYDFFIIYKNEYLFFYHNNLLHMLQMFFFLLLWKLDFILFYSDVCWLMYTRTLICSWNMLFV